MVATIEEAKNLLTYSFDELMCYVLSHEVRIKKSTDEDVEEIKGQMLNERHYEEGLSDGGG